MVQNRSSLPATLYTAEQCRALDRVAIERFSIPGFRLMQRAGHAVFAEMLQRWPGCRSVTVLCGAGNNGGDGLIVAGLAHQQGLKVQVLTLSAEPYPEQLQGEASQAWQWAEAVGVVTRPWRSEIELTGDIIIDAMLGTGLQGEVRGPVREAISRVNQCNRPVIAVDIPSGLCSDSGRVLGTAIKASLTLTFIGLKQGLLTHQGVDYCGELLFDGLMVPDELYEAIPVSGFRTDAEDVAEMLPPRQRSAHKGLYGHVMVVGGEYGMGGAALMAAEAAARSGSGLTSLATRPEHIASALARSPELMVQGVSSGQDVQPLLEKPDVLVVGPGLGQGAWAGQMMQKALASKKALVLDADALHFLHNSTVMASVRDAWVLTPHPGEAARLLGTDSRSVQDDRFAAVRELQERYGGTIVLKGAGTLTFDGDVIHLCNAGNPGMACGGMGDVLSGVIGALLAQGLKPVDAARIGVHAHALAADLCAAEYGERGLMATDLIAMIRRVLNGKVS
ncbi:NAD(P)H-hydrate dehydratase [Nitrincola alkalilacustris]|uniref:NAD(P)H-hydrate dehydratase n=1 Tax=Nitrincola alkalilacustris TaxID=1571224 RepID=UPI00124F6B20|nr:NAD(P)H-hydrate dehydratase [Nitrincola alkalilacustris]